MDLKLQQQKISQKATALQMNASNPTSSVWVSASAGTGKTHVLTQRMLRLMLSDPFLNISEILAITYTKAASMEMQNRLIEELSKWVKADEADLRNILEELLEKKPTIKDIQNARTLLVKVIDDPVGLNISTIHSFCETLLRKFPLESGIPSAFTLIEERQERQLLKKAWNKSLKNQFNDNKNLFSEVIDLMGEFSLENAISKILNEKNRFYKMLYYFETQEEFFQNLKKEFDITTLDENAIYQSIIEFDDIQLEKIKELFATSNADNSPTSQKLAIKLDKILAKQGSSEQLVNTYLDIWFNAKKEPRKAVAVKKIKESLSFEWDHFAQDEVLKLEIILDKITNIQNYKISKALSLLAYDMFKFYKKEKLALSLLDFNDLIDYSEELVNKSQIQDWIRYKLDSKIKHCLIDEAQDTDMQQWNILHALIAEFYYGDGQHETPRTTFAVGDMKQSIYRFRGANPEVFENIKVSLEEKTQNNYYDFKQVGLHTSFRSSAAVLNFVDDVFNDKKRKLALDNIDDDLHHQVYQFAESGRVEIAPILTKDDLEKAVEYSDYEIPTGKQEKTDSATSSTRLRRLNYNNVANKIENLFNNDNVKPEDIIILLPNRNGMTELINALTEKNIPHTGSDEIYLSTSIIIDDLISFAKFLCFDEDDLSLIQLLKSPIFGFNDQQVFTSYKKYKKNKQLKSFYYYLKEDDLFKTVYHKLTKYKNMVNNSRIFDIYLALDSDLDLVNKFMASFGGYTQAQQDQVKQTIQEFMKKIESFNDLSTLSFLNWFKKDVSKIKKNTANAKNAVRIMTVHGSKGLESKIVFLPDAGEDTIKSSASKFTLMFKKHEDQSNIDSLFIYKTRQTVKPTKIEQELQKNQEKLFFEDDMRLLYVALTRARNSIYVSGIQNNKELSQDSWYSILSQSAQYGVQANTIGYSMANNGTLVFEKRKQLESDAKAKDSSVLLKEETGDMVIPSWYNQKAENEQMLVQEKSSYEKSSLDYINDLKSEDSDNKSYSYGNVIHKLLEEVPKLNKDDRHDFIINYLENKPDIENQSKIAKDILNVIEKFEFIFSKDSLSEVSIQGVYNNKVIVGIVDKISILEDKVYIIDYKTGQKNDEYRQKYEKQLFNYTKVLKNIYKDKKIIPAILWVNLQELELI